MRARKKGSCARCGLVHTKLGIQIVGTAMYRDAVRERQQLRAFGGAWAYRADLIDGHPEVMDFEITDDEGTVYRADRVTVMRRSFRRDLGVGLQVILPLKFWRTVPPGGEIEHAPATTVENRKMPGPRWEQLGLAV